VVNKGASHVGFGATVSNQGIRGEFRRWDAQIAFDPKALNQSRVAATIEMGSAVTGDATRDQSLPTPDWFNVAAFPARPLSPPISAIWAPGAIRPLAT
jgi:polyisoprenoid-binding protein YceI